MEVIVEGKTIVECPRCHAVLKYDPDDIDEYNPNPETGVITQYVECPCCGKEVNI